MRAGTSASQACRSTSLRQAVWIRVWRMAARRPPPSDPQNSQASRPSGAQRSAAHVLPRCWSGATARRDLGQRAQNFAHVRCPASTSLFRPRDEPRCQLPPPVVHTAGGSAIPLAMLPPGDTSPCHHSLHLLQDGVHHNVLVLLNNSWVSLSNTSRCNTGGAA